MKRLLCFLLLSSTARAWQPPTHAGLTERAALASPLHKLLIDRMGLAQGLYEPLALHRGSGADRDLLRRAGQLDPEGGYAADDGRQTALGWLVAGSVLEGVPADRNRHHFFDPRDGRGLHDLDHGQPLRTRFADVSSGIGTFRGIFTGANFDGSGLPATEWLTGKANEWGVQRFLDERERAATARLPTEREDALVRSLLAAGAILHVVEDLGDPAHVRNDYRVALEGEGARLERLVASRWGRVGLPDGDDKLTLPRRGHLVELLHDASGGGLADRTQRRFFSDGTLPDTRRYPLPAAWPTDAPSGYVAGDAVAHLARWDRVPNGVVWSLDDKCLSDYAEAIVPEVARYTQAALELLFRGRLDLRAGEDGITVRVHDIALGAGTVSLYGDSSSGERHLITKSAVSGAADEETLLTAHADAPTLTAVFRGVDAAGEPIVLVGKISSKR
jgi:hypothetical protein